MVEITLDVTKTLDENAARYFEKAKKARKKREGAQQALEIQKKALEKAKKQQEKQQHHSQIPQRKKFWWEKFRWFFSSEGFLCIGGRDATTNEILIKKHMDPEDLVFHTDMAGSPFFLVKKQSQQESVIGEATKEEVAIATASFSKAWKAGLVFLDVFYVKPEQVTKKAQSGEYLGKGSFMIYGKTTYLRPKIELAVALIAYEGILLPMCGPLSAVKAHAVSNLYLLRQGKQKPSDVAKQLARAFQYYDLDEFIRILPPGNLELVQRKDTRTKNGS